MVILLGLLPLVVLASLIGLFFKRVRKRSAMVLVASFIAFVVLESRVSSDLDRVAQDAGFLDHEDLIAAHEAEILSAADWEEERAEREEAARRRAEQDRYQRECGDRQHIAAYVMSQAPVTSRLRAPATADYPNITQVRVRSVGDCQFEIHAFVDAQNGFGAQIRTNYRAVMQRHPEADTWSLVELDM